MTEAEWLACAEPGDMLEFARGQANDRSVMLFAAACCRRIWPVLHPRFGRCVVELTERTSDGLAGGDSLRAAVREAHDYAESDEARHTESGCSAAYAIDSLAERYPGEPAVWIASRTADRARNTRYWMAFEAVGADGSDEGRARPAGDAAESGEGVLQATFLRDVLGNPFRPVTIDNAWQTSTVLALATAAYENRILPAGTLEPARLAVLSDALEEAGCNDTDVLSHLRGPGPHVRGCWPVDLLLAKE